MISEKSASGFQDVFADLVRADNCSISVENSGSYNLWYRRGTFFVLHATWLLAGYIPAREEINDSGEEQNDRLWDRVESAKRLPGEIEN